MKNLKEMLEGMTDRRVSTLATKIWDAYMDDAEDGIGNVLNVDPKEASRMLDCMEEDIETPAQLADCMMIYRDGATEEAYLKAELRKIKEREAQIKARLKALEGTRN